MQMELYISNIEHTQWYVLEEIETTKIKFVNQSTYDTPLRYTQVEIHSLSNNSIVNEILRRAAIENLKIQYRIHFNSHDYLQNTASVFSYTSNIYNNDIKEFSTILYSQDTIYSHDSDNIQ